MTEVYPGLGKEVLPSGLEVWVEPLPYVQSVAVGLWVKAGSREDPAGQEGLAHLLEHLTFKGTVHHSAREIAQLVDLLGGHLNAGTTPEFTVFHTEVLARGFREAGEILRELVTEPRLDPQDVRREQVVISEEIRALEDDPEDTAFRLVHEVLWPGKHPLGRPVAGELSSIQSIQPEDVHRFFAEHYRPPNMLLVASGRVDPQEVVALGTTFSGANGQATSIRREPPAAGSGARLAERDVQQVHIALGFPTVPLGAPERYALEVLNAILGGGVSSRLFQRVREDLALVYVVFSANSFHSDAGALVVYAATEEAKAAQVLDAIWQEIELLAKEPVGEEELRRAVQRLQNAFLLSLDDPASRMMRVGSARAVGLKPASPEEVIQRLGRVTAEEVQELARKFLPFERAAMGLVGPSAEQLERLVRAWAEVN